MWRFGVRRVGYFILGLMGAALLAACVTSLAEPHSVSAAFGGTLIHHFLAIANLDFGTSSVSAIPAWIELSHYLPATLELIGLGAVIAMVLGAPAAVLLSDRRAARVGTPILKLMSAVPALCVALAVLWLFENLLHWAPVAQPQSLVAAIARGNLGQIRAALLSLAPPALTVGVAGAYSLQNILRRAVVHGRNEPYRRGLRALGLGRFEIDSLYLLPQVLAALVYNLGDIALSLVAATAVAEWVFDWPGAAGLFLKSVALRDWTVAGLILFVFAAITITAQLAGAFLARFLAESEAVQ
jgi:peptide/nickel transport system permease protein